LFKIFQKHFSDPNILLSTQFTHTKHSIHKPTHHPEKKEMTSNNPYANLTDEEKNKIFGGQRTQEDVAEEVVGRFEEMNRRANLGNSSSGASSAKSSKRTTNRAFNLIDPNQQWVVLQVAHKNLPPKTDGPKVRICGFFQSKELAMRHRDAIHKLDGNVTTVTYPVGEPLVIASTIEKFTDDEYQKKKATENRQLYLNILDEHTKEFKKNVEEKKTGSVPLDQMTYSDPLEKIQKRRKILRTVRDEAIAAVKSRKAGESVEASRTSKFDVQKSPIPSASGRKTTTSTEAPTAVTTSEPTESTESNGNKIEDSGAAKIEDTFPFPRNLEVRSQSIAAVVFIRDIEYQLKVGKKPGKPYDGSEEEVTVVVLQSFDSDDVANDYVENCAHNELSSFNIDCVSMYEWLDVIDIEEKHLDEIQEKFDEPELDKIMQARKTEKQKKVAFEEYCRQQQISVPVTEVDISGTVREFDEQGNVTVKQVERNGVNQTNN
jgi:hypothetical protein